MNEVVYIMIAIMGYGFWKNRKWLSSYWKNYKEEFKDACRKR